MLQERQVVVVPMTRQEVRSAIVEPARLARLDVADGLVELLLSDLAPRSPAGSLTGAGHEAGALPLLSHALLTTWSRRHGGRLTRGGLPGQRGYQARDRPDGRQVYGASMRSSGTSPGGSSCAWCTWPTTHRRRAARCGWTSCVTGRMRRSSGEVLDRFVAERLITVDADTAQITHEALLTAWPLLRTWIDANREGLRVRRRLSDAARTWDEAGRDPAALLRGGQLALARDWAADPVNRDSLGR